MRDPLIYGASTAAAAASWICGAGLILLSLPRGRIAHVYAGWNKAIV